MTDANSKPRRRGKSKAKQAGEPTTEAKTPKPGGNGFDPALTQNFVERIENLHGDIASIMSGALNDCKAVHGDIKLVYQEAKDEHGIPKKALKNVVKARALEAKAAAVREDLDGEDQDNFDLIRQALGDLADTPLGQAATGRRTIGDQMREPGGALASEGHTDVSAQPFAPPVADEPRTADPT